MESPSIEKWLKRASVLIGLGLAIQFLSLTRAHPLAFVAFLVVGCPLVAAGVVLYLVSLVIHRDR